MERDTWIGKSICLYGEYFQKQLDLIEHYANDCGLIVEVGSYIGTETMALSNKAMVFAFEPQPLIFDILCKNIELYRVVPHKLAVWHTTGKLYCLSPELKIDGVPFYESFQDFSGVFLTTEPRFDSDILVEAVRLDDYSLPQCGMIRVDIGPDCLHPLRGAVETIKKHKPIIFVNVDPWVMPTVVRFMEEIGYNHKTQRLPVFNKNNLYDNPEDLMRLESDPQTPVTVASMLCYPTERSWEIEQSYYKIMKELL